MNNPRLLIENTRAGGGAGGAGGNGAKCNQGYDTGIIAAGGGGGGVEGSTTYLNGGAGGFGEYVRSALDA